MFLQRQFKWPIEIFPLSLLQKLNSKLRTSSLIKDSPVVYPFAQVQPIQICLTHFVRKKRKLKRTNKLRFRTTFDAESFNLEGNSRANLFEIYITETNCNSVTFVCWIDIRAIYDSRRMKGFPVDVAKALLHHRAITFLAVRDIATRIREICTCFYKFASE